MDPELRKQPTADEGADNANNDVAEDLKPAALQDVAGQPERVALPARLGSVQDRRTRCGIDRVTCLKGSALRLCMDLTLPGADRGKRLARGIDILAG